MVNNLYEVSDKMLTNKQDEKVKKGKQNSKRLRDIRRLLRNNRIKLDCEKKTELEKEASILEISENERRKNKSYKKKLYKYLEYKKNKQKTMRFVELVKVKRKINKLQKELVTCIENKNTDDIEDIKSKMKLFKSYEDYIRLSPFFKDRKYIPLFSNTQLDPNSISERGRFIEDIQDLKEKLRSKKCKSFDSSDLPTNDSFLLDEKVAINSSNSNITEKIEYKINNTSNKNHSTGAKGSKGIGKTSNNSKSIKNESKSRISNNIRVNTEDKKDENKQHIIFSDSE
ncbi:hypothetical protein RS030_162449 [Cryptosporidium xiaoi]|uniref:rRNA-processing protein efg1 n=1 Tax=Cryptosporidium xiaoi TaxID=659607 RepID=A0AAV9Y076_9CRYT